VTIGKARCSLVIESLGERGNGSPAESGGPRPSIQVRPHRPKRQDLADAWTNSLGGRPWTQPIGFQDALFEVAIDILQTRQELARIRIDPAAIVATTTNSMVVRCSGPGQPVKTSPKEPLVAGQWQRKGGNSSW